MDLKILLADDHPLILQGTKGFLNDLGYTNILTSEDGLHAYSLIIKEKPAVIILDYNMPKLNGLELAKLCKKEKIDSKIILLTLQRNELILKEVGKTIDAYLLKEDALDKLKECIKLVGENNTFISDSIQRKSIRRISNVDFMNKLTSSEIKILNQISKNYSSKEIAENLFISVRTVEKHRSNIIQKLGLEKNANSLQQFVDANIESFNF